MDRTRSTRGPTRAWGWAAAVFFLALAGGARAEDKALTTVVQVDNIQGKTEVVLAAGLLDGMAPAAQVELLREGQPIVHPVTGQVLGTPQEPVGVVRVYQVQDRQSRGMVIKAYSPPQVDDLAEYEMVVPEPAPPPPPPAPAAREDSRIGTALERLDRLEAKVEQYRKSARAARPEPAAPDKAAWDELATMKNYLTSLDRRLAALEAQQGADRTRLDALASGEYKAMDVREFTVRYTADTQVRLKVAGKTLLISVERDSMHLEEEPAPAAAAKALPEPAAESQETPGLEPLAGEAQKTPAPAAAEAAPEPEKAAEQPALTAEQVPVAPWYQSPWVMGAGILVLGLLGGVVWYVIKRRYDDVMEGLEEFEEEEEDDEEEEEEETPVRRKKK